MLDHFAFKSLLTIAVARKHQGEQDIAEERKFGF